MAAVPIGWNEVLKRTGAEVYRGHCLGWAAELAYFFFLALFPALLFVVSLASFLPVQTLIDRILDMFVRFAPGDVAAIARSQLVQITHERHAGLLAISFVGTIWSTSSGMTAIIDTLNQTYHVTEGRPWWRVRITAIALTIALVVFTLISFALVMVGPALADRLASGLGRGPLFALGWKVVQWPAAFALVATAVGFVYHFAPDVEHEWVWLTPGSVAATALWLLSSLGFKWYVIHFGNYQETYGAIGGVIVALLWFYFSGLAVLLGAQLNATIQQASADGTLPAKKPA
ncbi:MAG: YihY/virulence factor BrkB family protein [Acidobacteria bacterium]|nr:YihY/virulence factor BrkB family protein [Acidobacteriota bacterium]